MLTREGAVPLSGEALSQLPPSEVLISSVQFKVPDPPFRICNGWLGGARPPVTRLKVIWPGRLSKNAVVGSATVRLTGIVIAMLPFCAVNTICPVYVPTGRVGLVVTIAVSVCGVEQRTQPPKLTFFTESQLPPVAVDTLVVKLKLAPVLAAVKVWGSG